jgi:hypothetical protein
MYGKPEKKPLVRHWHRWKNNIRLDLTETGWEGVEWMHLAQDRDLWQVLVKTVMNFLVP